MRGWPLWCYPDRPDTLNQFTPFKRKQPTGDDTGTILGCQWTFCCQVIVRLCVFVIAGKWMITTCSNALTPELQHIMCRCHASAIVKLGLASIDRVAFIVFSDQVSSDLVNTFLFCSNAALGSLTRVLCQSFVFVVPVCMTVFVFLTQLLLQVHISAFYSQSFRC